MMLANSRILPLTPLFRQGGFGLACLLHYTCYQVIKGCNLRLKTNIFLWVVLASVLPMAVLALVAITYSEQQYLKDASHEVNASLSNMVSEIDRRLYYERQMILSLARSATMQRYLPILKSVTQGDLHPRYFQRSEQLEKFLSGFQGVVPGFRSIRVLDAEGNTLIKVKFGLGVVGRGDGLESSPYAEDEIEDPVFVKQLQQLTPSELSFIVLPESRWDKADGTRGPTMHDAVYPLGYEKKIIGYLMVSFSGDQIDKILDVVPRVHNGKLMLAELNADRTKRDGLLLYDDVKGLRLNQPGKKASYLNGVTGKKLLSRVRSKPDGELVNEKNNSITYYTEYLPYPKQLSSWVLSAQVDKKTLFAPFDQIRKAILLLVVIAVLLSLLLANYGAKKIVRPITALARSLKRYADGDHKARVRVGGADELQQMEKSFNYMADTLDHAQMERDNAYQMMLQTAKLASIGEMAAGIGHEINNPLNNMLSLIKLLKRDLSEDSAHLKDDLDSLREEILRASSIVKGILNFARQLPTQYSCFSALQWLEETTQLVQQAARSRHIAIHVIADHEVTMIGDRGQLQQVLVNLLLNAIQASQKDSDIIVSLVRQAGYIVISIEDHGGGILPENINRIFDPFFTTKEVGEGSGLGLSISMGIVQRHNGQLTIENNTDGGVTAIIKIPQTQEEIKKEKIT